ncbi:hypothetical protein SteCoe_20337 [Stentor coeruleus]|uniref:E2F/DP family winged-helix DNA-binding domain-containing protein n=1 Tax=Stentor coeruleus TaxID=5963 RepID=A0A1R2BSH0_9CILI|nr:hypothetical protein SteCoe_20337 [Stentor coeruleus]
MNDSPNLRYPLQDRNKKLINLSRQVLEYVRSTDKTTGNQIAREIIHGFPNESFDSEFKNIQRRVYDALNVLHALSIISKNRNEIKYRGLVDKEDLSNLHEKISEKKKIIEAKRMCLGENVMQFVALHKLIRRNQVIKKNADVVELPCLVVYGETKANMQFFDDSMMISSLSPFTILSDCHLLAKMNLHKFTKMEISEHFPQEIFNLLDKSCMRTDESSEEYQKEVFIKNNIYN